MFPLVHGTIELSIEPVENAVVKILASLV